MPIPCLEATEIDLISELRVGIGRVDFRSGGEWASQPYRGMLALKRESRDCWFLK